MTTAVAVDRPVASVPRLWQHSTVVCVGGGPSLTTADVDYCRGKARVVAINDAIRLAPWADVLYAADAKWWAYYKGVELFDGLKFGLEPAAAKWGVTVLRNSGETGLETDPTALRAGRNSGYQAINLAVHLGAARVLLLGYDMAPSESGKTHWFGDHPQAIRAHSPYAAFLDRFKTLAGPLRRAGVEVVNCTRVSALNVFPFATIEEALA